MTAAVQPGYATRHARAAHRHGHLHIPKAGLAFFGDLLLEAERLLGEEETERARADGSAMNLDQILELVATHGA